MKITVSTPEEMMKVCVIAMIISGNSMVMNTDIIVVIKVTIRRLLAKMFKSSWRKFIRSRRN